MTWNNLCADTVINGQHIMENFNSLRAQRFDYKTTTEREALIPRAGYLIYDSDLRTLFAGNGTSWVEVG